MMAPDPLAYAAVFVALALGGILKGATGLGAPLVAVPVMAGFFDVRLAVVMMVLPSLITNLWQLWVFRAHTPGRFAWRFALSGGAGAIAGTAMLAAAPTRLLSLIMAGAVLVYVVLRILRSNVRLAATTADRLAMPMGAFGGLLQGASGISAPVAVSFLNAVGFERARFIPTISLFFGSVAVIQVIALAFLGLYDAHIVGLSLVAVLPLAGFMPLGAWLARSVSQRNFDRLILGILVILALKLIVLP